MGGGKNGFGNDDSNHEYFVWTCGDYLPQIPPLYHWRIFYFERSIDITVLRKLSPKI